MTAGSPALNLPPRERTEAPYVSPYVAAPTRALDQFLDGLHAELLHSTLTDQRERELMRMIVDVEAELMDRGLV